MSTFSVGRQYSRGCQRYIDVAFIIQFDFFFSLRFFYCWYYVDRTTLRSSFILMRARSMVAGRTVAVWVHIYFCRFVVFIYILRSPLPPPPFLSRNRFLFFRILCVWVRERVVAQAATRILLWHNIKFYRQFWRCGVAYHKVEQNNPLFPSNSSSLAHRNKRPTDTISEWCNTEKM